MTTNNPGPHFRPTNDVDIPTSRNDKADPLAYRVARRARAKELVNGGMSLRQAAKVLGVPKSTIHRDVFRPSFQAPKPDKTSTAANVQAATTPEKLAGLAACALDPSLGAGSVASVYAELGARTNCIALAEELKAQMKALHGGDLRRGEEILLAQAHTLDAIFNSLARRAAMNMGQYMAASETYLRLALKAQSQCRATLETLAAIKNPAPVAFVRQANIGYHQQVNNPAGPAKGAPRARETEIPQSELLEVRHGERLDTRTTSATVGADPALATVGEIDRAANR